MATPLTAVTVAVPPRVSSIGSLTVTLPLKLVSRVPKLSSAWTAKPKPEPAVAVPAVGP